MAGTIIEQLPFAFGHDAASTRDDLRVSGSLAAAAAIVDQWPQWPSPVVILCGPPGCGKSHLASIWRARSGASLIDPQKGSNAAQTAASGPVLFEDADCARFDEETLFHVINSVREHSTSLLITSRTLPSTWPVTLPDLASRLKAGTLVLIGPPDDALLAQVLVKLFADRQLAVDDRVVSYLVARMERSLDAARRIVEALDRLALSRGTRISRALAQDVLQQYSHGRETD